MRRRRRAPDPVVASAPGTRALFEAAFAAIPAAAFVTDPAGAVLEANPAGRLWLEREALAGRQALREAVARARDRRFAVTPIVAQGAPARRLVVMRPESEPLARMRVAAVVAPWSLTARERQVLELLVEGVTTRAAAALLGISTRAVEVHITALLEKAQVERRAELCAAVWRNGA